MDMRHSGSGSHADFIPGILNFERGRFRCFDHCPGKIFAKDPGWRNAHTEHSIAKCGDTHLCFAHGKLHAVRKLFNFLYVADVLPALSRQCKRP